VLSTTAHFQGKSKEIIKEKRKERNNGIDQGKRVQKKKKRGTEKREING
jgi:hypothetical protein